jgi:hypothetical protein
MRRRRLALALTACGSAPLAALSLAACGGREPAPSQPDSVDGTAARSTAATSAASSDAGTKLGFDFTGPAVGAEGDEDHVRIDLCDESHGPNLDDLLLRRAIGRCYVDAGLVGQDVDLRVTVEADGENPAIAVTGGPDGLVFCVELRVEDYILETGALGHAGCTIHLSSPPP